MRRHRRPDGTYELPVDGWDKLAADQRKQLAERLKSVAVLSLPSLGPFLSLTSLQGATTGPSPGSCYLFPTARPREARRTLARHV
jgi:hypothetical protein